MENIQDIKSKIIELRSQLNDCKASKTKKSMLRDEISKLEKWLEEEEKKKKDQNNEMSISQSETYEIDEDEFER